MMAGDHSGSIKIKMSVMENGLTIHYERCEYALVAVHSNSRWSRQDGLWGPFRLLFCFFVHRWLYRFALKIKIPFCIDHSRS